MTRRVLTLLLAVLLATAGFCVAETTKATDPGQPAAGGREADYLGCSPDDRG